MIFKKYFFIVAIAILCSLQNAQAMFRLRPLLSMLMRQQSPKKTTRSYATYINYPTELPHTTVSKQNFGPIQKITYTSSLQNSFVENKCTDSITASFNNTSVTPNKAFKRLPEDFQREINEIMAKKIHETYDSYRAQHGNVQTIDLKVIHKKVRNTPFETSKGYLPPGLSQHFNNMGLSSL